MKRILLLFTLFTFGLCNVVNASSENVTKAKSAIKAKNEKQAFEYYKKAMKANPRDAEALAGASLMCSRIGNRTADKSLRSSYFKAANTYANAALKVAPTSAEANYVKSVALGRVALISGAKDKVAASRNIKKYAEKAIKYNSKHAGAWHVLGRWNYGVATLNFAERAAANALFGGIPEGSIAKCISCYKKSMSYDPSYILNYLELGKAYIEDGQTSAAKSILAKGMKKPSLLQDDDATKKECKSLYNSL